LLSPASRVENPPDLYFSLYLVHLIISQADSSEILALLGKTCPKQKPPNKFAIPSGILHLLNIFVY